MRTIQRFKKILTCFVVGFGMAVSPVLAQTEDIEDNSKWEYAQKAKIIKYLVSTVNWPASAVSNNTMNVCVLGELDYAKPINELNNVKINPFTIKVKKITKIDLKPNSCQILYVAKDQAAKVEEIKKAYKGLPVLLLGDMDHFAQEGGSMNFVVVHNLVAITVNLETLRLSNIHFDIKTYSQITVIPTPEDIKDNKN